MDNIFLKAISKTIDLVTSGRISDDEAARIGKSDYCWADGKVKKYYSRTISKGDIYQFDFGKNLDPEMSYEHRGLVLGKVGQLVYVLPIYSYVTSKKNNLYDSVSNPKGTLYFLSAANHSFLKHDSVMKLNDIRTVSTKRILFHQNNGHIDINSDEYKEIELLTFSFYFPTLHYELMSYRKS